MPRAMDLAIQKAGNVGVGMVTIGNGRHLGMAAYHAMLALPHDKAVILICLVWGGALLGIAFRVFWIGAPRWLYVPLYVLPTPLIVTFPVGETPSKSRNTLDVPKRSGSSRHSGTNASPCPNISVIGPRFGLVKRLS